MLGIDKDDNEKNNAGMTVLAVLLTIVGLVVSMLVFYRLWCAYSKRRITGNSDFCTDNEEVIAIIDIIATLMITI